MDDVNQQNGESYAYIIVAVLIVHLFHTHKIYRHRHTDDPAESKNNCVLFFGMNGNVFPYHCTWPEIERCMSAYACAFEAYPAAYPEGSENMLVAAYDRNTLTVLAFINDFF